MKRVTVSDIWYIHCQLCSVDVFPAKLLVHVDANKIKLLYPNTLALSHIISSQAELLLRLACEPGSLMFCFCW